MRAWFARVLVTAVSLVAIPLGSARADEVAPSLEDADLRLKAAAELKRLVSGLAPNDQKRLVGVYPAFDPSSADAVAQVACDDDGDYVVVLSDAMLRLLTYVARADSYDEANGSRKVEEYAAFLVRSQTPGRRLLPPPPGFYIAERPSSAADERFAEALSFVLARELTHFRAGDLACPKPTATRESGDDVWTAAEQRKASEVAFRVYPGRQLERDNEATVRMLEAGHNERGALALLRFFTQFEGVNAVVAGRFLPSYAQQHPQASWRASAVQRAASAHRAQD